MLTCRICGVPIAEVTLGPIHGYGHVCHRRGNPHYAQPRREELRVRARREAEEDLREMTELEKRYAWGDK